MAQNFLYLRTSLLRNVAKMNNEAAALLKEIRDTLVRDVQKEAQHHLWHLNRQLWYRKGSISQCLAETINCLVLVLKQAQSGQPDDLGTEIPSDDDCVYAEMKHCLPNWFEASLTCSDIHILLNIQRRQIRAAFISREVGYPGHVIEGSLLYVCSFVASNKMEKAEEEGSLQRQEFVAAQHLAADVVCDYSREVRP